MDAFLELYEQNKKLDAMYVELYGDDKQIFNKNVLEILVELGELANETRCFKYWSKKGMSDKEIVLEEFADCITMCLYFCNFLNIDINKIEFKINDLDIVNQFIFLYKECSLLKELTEKRVTDIFIGLKNLGIKLGFSDEEVISSCLKKLNKNIERINSNY